MVMQYKYKIYELTYKVKDVEGRYEQKPSGYFFTSSKKAFEFARMSNSNRAKMTAEQQARVPEFGGVIFTRFVF